MAKRMLNQDEIKVSQKSIDRMTEQLRIFKDDLKNFEFHLDFFIDYKARQARREISESRAQTQNAIDNLNGVIKTLKEQMINGVEAKEAKNDGKQ